jgi:broad specificity phosphatase PhoE
VNNRKPPQRNAGSCPSSSDSSASETPSSLGPRGSLIFGRSEKMKISLVRHGRPQVDFRTRISGGSFGAWLDGYDKAALDAAFRPPPELREILADCGCVITSRAPRAVLSADMLGIGAKRVVFDEACEASVPRRIFCPFRVRPLTLTVLARTLWLLGLGPSSESKADALCRARQLSARLEALAEEEGHIALVGHGYIHRFCGRSLGERGWATVSKGTGYWSLTQLEKDGKRGRGVTC